LISNFRELSEAAKAYRRDNGFQTITLKTAGSATIVPALRNMLSPDISAEQANLCDMYLSGLEEFLATNEVDVGQYLTRASKKGLTQHDIRPIVGLLNEDFVHEHGVELTGHGIERTFRFWSDDQKRDYLNLAGGILSTIKKKFPNAMFGYGFVLSMARNGDLMPHDDDIDIIVTVPAEEYETITDALVDLSTFLISEGCSVYGTWPSHRKVFWPGGAQDIDVFISLQDGDDVAFFPGPRKGMRFSDVFPAATLDFLGVSCPVPNNQDKYLSALYGEDWKTPKPSWHHSWDARTHRDILRPTLFAYPFQAEALMRQGARFVVLNHNNTLLSVHAEEPKVAGPGVVRDLESIVTEERLVGYQQ
jgi:hypothetical protein